MESDLKGRVEGSEPRRADKFRGAWWRSGVLCVTATLLVACGEGGTPETSAQEFDAASIPVETLRLRPQTFVDSYLAPGLIEAAEEISISAEIAGRVIAVNFDIGDEVSKGDLLVSVDDAAIQARIRKINTQTARAETMLKKAQKDLERQETLFSTNVAAESARDDAQLEVQAFENDLAAAEAELGIAQIDLDHTKIRSPISGTVSERTISAGEYVTPGTQLLDVVMTDVVDFVFSLGEKDVTKIADGDVLDVRIDAYEDRTFTGKVKVLAPAGNRSTRTFRVELLIDNPAPHPLKPGMAGKTQMVRARYEDVYLLPEEAILREGTRSYVYLINDGHATAADVEIIASVGAKAVVVADFAEDADCIILGQHALSADSKIRVVRKHEKIPELEFD